MGPRPPADAVVTLRGLGRRFRGVFAGLGDDESPDDLAHRVGPAGHSALDQVVHAAGSIATAGHAVAAAVAEDDPQVTIEAASPTAPRGTIDERLDEVTWEADALADRIAHLGASDWARTATLPDGAAVTALDIVWSGVDQAVADLKSAEAILREVRQRP